MYSKMFLLEDDKEKVIIFFFKYIHYVTSNQKNK